MILFTFGTDKSKIEALVNSALANRYKIEVRGTEETWRGFGSKLLAMRDFCAELPSSELVVFLDAYDVLAVGPDAERLYEENYHGKIVFSAEKNCWPDAQRASEYPQCDSPWRYLNSGSYMGTAGDIYNLLNGIKIDAYADDQRLMTTAFFDGKVVLDTKCIIFQTIGFTNEVKFMAGKVYNTVTKTYPQFIHGNGRTPMDNLYRFTLEEEASKYTNTVECHRDIVDRFTKYVNADEALKAHRDYVEANGYGYGERAFHWMWKLIVDAMPQSFRFLEIGVFKGQIPSLVTMLAAMSGKEASVTGIARFDGFAGNSFPEHPEHSAKDVMNLFGVFNLRTDNLSLIEGDSTSDEVHKRVKKLRKFDVIYIDGCHEYEYVKKDLEFYTTKLAPSGLLVIDDAACALKQPWGYFQGIESVSRATDEVLANHKNILTVMHNRIFR